MSSLCWSHNLANSFDISDSIPHPQLILHAVWTNDVLWYKAKVIVHESPSDNFYETEIEILAGFGSVGNTEKKVEPIMSNFWGRLCHVFMGKKIFFSGNIVVSALKSCIKWREKNLIFHRNLIMNRPRNISNCFLPY